MIVVISNSPCLAVCDPSISNRADQATGGRVTDWFIIITYPCRHDRWNTPEWYPTLSVMETYIGSMSPCLAFLWLSSFYYLSLFILCFHYTTGDWHLQVLRGCCPDYRTDMSVIYVTATAVEKRVVRGQSHYHSNQRSITPPPTWSQCHLIVVELHSKPSHLWTSFVYLLSCHGLSNSLQSHRHSGLLL